MTLPFPTGRPRHLAVLLAAGLISGPFSACQRQDAPGASATKAILATTSLRRTMPDTPVLAPRPAPEYFESLTEQALTATPAELDVLLGQAKSAAARDARRLNSEAASELVRRLREMDSAREHGMRADLAISSIEAFRLFVSAGAGGDGVPVQVSLLDYTGFRYAVDVSTAPVRWDDAALAADVASAQWDTIDASVADVGLRGRFGAAVIALKSAARSRDPDRAGPAAQAELDLVDALEIYFKSATR